MLRSGLVLTAATALVIACGSDPKPDTATTAAPGAGRARRRRQL